MRRAQWRAISRPTSTEPVKLIAATPGWLTSASPMILPRPMTRLNTPGAKTGTGEDLRDGPCAAGSRVRGFEDDGVAEGEGGGGLPGRDRDGEVPGGDQPHDPQRLADDVDLDAGADGREMVAPDPEGLPREELEDLSGPQYFAESFGEDLAFLAGQQPREFVLASEDLGSRRDPGR